MKYIFWILLLFAAAIALSVASHNPAYVLLVYPPYRIELSLSMFVFFYILIFVFGYVLLRLVLSTMQLPSYVRKFRLERAQSKSQKLLDDALNAFFEGRYALAEKISARAIQLRGASALHPIIAARAAHELRDFDKRDAYLAESRNRTAGETTMKLMSVAKFKLDQKQPQAALDSLKELSDSGIRKHAGALNLELKAQQQAKNWDAVLELIKQLEKQKSIDTITADQLRQQAWLEKLQDQTQDTATLSALWKAIPRKFKDHANISAAAAQAFSSLGDHQSAQQLLSDYLKSQWNSELVALYGDCASGDAMLQIEQAEKWLAQHNQDANLLLALGKLCLHQKLWGKAQNYLDASISLEPSNAAYTALGQLAENMGKPEQAVTYFKKAEQYCKEQTK